MSNGHRGSGQRLAKQWGVIPAQSFGLTANSTTIGPNLPATASQTVLRMLGEYILGSTGVATAQDEVLVVVGIGVIATDLATVGGTGIPDPAGEPDFPWLYWASHSLFYPSAVSGTAGQGDQSRLGSVRVPFDIKSMRKMKPRESLALIVQYVDINGTPPIRFGLAHSRILLGLH